MKDNNTYFFITLATIALAGFLLFKIYDGKKIYQSLKSEYDSYKSEQEEKEKNKEEWSEGRYWDFTFKYPKDWHLALFFTNDERKTKTYAMSPYPIDLTRVAFSKGIYELTIYEDTSLFNDDFWKKEQENYLKELELIEPETIETEYGTINYYKAKEGQKETAPGQNVEAYFYKFNYTLKSDKGDVKKTIYLKLELLYLEDWRITKMMREIALSIKPVQ